MDVVVRTSADPMRLAAAVRDAVQTFDAHAPVFGISTLEERIDVSLAPRRFQSGLLGLLSAIALALAAIGLYGLMHYSVAQRTHEIGIRMALGANAGDVVRMVLRQGAIVTAAGLGAGLAGSLLVTRLLSGLLFQVTPTDPVTFAIVPALTGRHRVAGVRRAGAARGAHRSARRAARRVGRRLCRDIRARRPTRGRRTIPRLR